MPQREKFVIFDGNALLHRAYHALPPLTTKDGTLVNAAYGFTTIFLRVLKELKPKYVAVTFDRKEPTFRHAAFKEYKAQREKKPQELYDQIDIIRDIVAAFNIPVFDAKGYEADDVIGTLTKLVEDEGAESIIVTGDLDTLQLVDDHTSVYTLRKGLADTIMYNEAAVFDRYGLKPNQLVEYRALKGDPSDNIPGVGGIGEKTAAELIKQFGSLAALYDSLKKNDARAKKLPPRLRELLVNSKAAAELARRLSEIVRDVPLDFSLGACRLKGFDMGRLVELFHALEFKSLLARIPELQAKLELTPQAPLDTSGKEKKIVATDYTLVETEAELTKLAVKLAKVKSFALDTETTSVNPLTAELVGISLSPKLGEAYFVSAKLKGTTAWAKLAAVLGDNTIKKTAHNAKFDLQVLTTAGIPFTGLAFDTMIAAFLLKSSERVLDLKSLVFQEFGVQMKEIQELIGKKGKDQKTMDQVPLSQVADYACADADYTLRLQHKFEPELGKQGVEQLFHEVEVPLVPVLATMERAGVKVDVAYLGVLAKEMARDISALEKTIYKLAGEEFNISSPKQLKVILFDKLKVSPEGLKHTKTGVSTAASELEKMRGLHPIIDHLFNYRELTKLLSTYVEAIPELVDKTTNRVHSSFNQTVAATGRLSSSDPNLQNIPARGEWGQRIRKAFVAEKGFVLISADYSQIELRLAAHLASDGRMIQVFKQGQDIHAATASFIFGVKQDEVTPDQRRAAKEVNFGILYGMGAWGLAERTGLSRTEAKQFIERYFKAFSRVAAWIEEVKKDTRRLGYAATLLGRRRYLPEINSSVQQVVAAAERMAVNLPVQGTAADLMKVAMIKVANNLPQVSKKARLVLQVHDELVFEVPAGEEAAVAAMVRREMEQAVKLTVPIVVDVKAGKNWAEMEVLT